MTAGVLAGCAAVLGGAFLGMATLGDLTAEARAFVVLFGLAGAAYGLAGFRILRHPPRGRRALLGICGAGLAFRLVLLPTAPSLSTDLYRYVWDGRVSVAGLSPYGYPPNAAEVAALRDETIYPRLNHVDWYTIYPPGAQVLFAAVARLAPGSPLALKLLVAAFDVATAGLLLGWLRALGRPPAWVLLYAWHPLVVVELAGSGHLDAAAVAASVAALWAGTRERGGWAGALVGVGALVKLYPLLLLPAVWRPRPARTLAACGAVVGAGYALYAHEGTAVLGSLPRYLGQEEFNGSLRVGLGWLFGPLGPAGLYAARLLPLVGLVALALGLGLAPREVPAWRRAFWIVGAYLLATPNLFPWYAVWIVPLLAVSPSWPWLYLTGAVALTYLVFAQPVWQIPAWVTVAEFGPFVLGLALAARLRGTVPGHHGPGGTPRMEVSR